MIEIVREGGHTFPSFTLFTTDGDGEDSISIGDVVSVSWVRKVVGTGETVNSRTGTAVTPSAIPFEIEQLPADNTRVNSSRRRERHEVIVTYTYTRSGETKSADPIVREFLIVPAAGRIVYKVLSEDSRFLRKIKAGFTSSDQLDQDELWDVEEDVTEEIEAELGKRFYSSSLTIPRIIEQIADLLGSAQVIDFILVTDDGTASKYAAALRKRAYKLLEDVKKGRKGVQYPDGSWDSEYPAPKRTNRTAKGGRRRNLVFDRSRPFHEQFAHDPTETDDTNFGHDDRTARQSEYD